MNLANLKLMHKFILLISCLVLLVSIALMVTSTYLSRDGKKRVQQGVAQKLEVLRRDSIEEFDKFTDVVDDGIAQASGLASIEKIISIATEDHQRFMEVVNKAIEKVGDDVATAVALKSTIVSEGLDSLLTNSTDFMNDIMEADNTSMNMLANVAAFNMDSLNTSSMDSLRRFTLLIEDFEQKLLQNQEIQHEEMDNLLIQIIDDLEKSGQQDEKLVESLLEAFEHIKEISLERQHALYQELHDAFDLQSQLVVEELNLVKEKVQYAINLELSHAIAIQEEEIDIIIDNLLENQLAVQEKIDATNAILIQAVEALQTELPVTLKKEGEEVSRKIQEESANARTNAEDARTEVSSRIKNSTLATAATFEAGIGQTEHLISQILDTSSARTLGWNSVIIVICVVLSLGFGIVMTRAITKPLNQVVQLVEKVSTGDFSETLNMHNLDTNDEIGRLLFVIDNMVGIFRKILGQIQRSGIQVTSSSTELAATAKQQEVTIATQVESTNKVLNSVGEISSVVTALVETMQQVTSMSQETTEIASSGQTDLAHMEEAMHQMEEASHSISSRLQAINEKTDNITNVVTTINKVADQTNLLSLNASIEAEKRASMVEALPLSLARSGAWRTRLPSQRWISNRWCRRCNRLYQQGSWKWTSSLPWFE